MGSATRFARRRRRADARRGERPRARPGRGGRARRGAPRLRRSRPVRAARGRISFHEIDLELASRAVAAMGLREAVADPEMPVAIADRLRADGLVLRPDHGAIAARRRVKSAAELDGIRRAQRPRRRPGWPPPRRLLRRPCPTATGSRSTASSLTAEAVRAALRDACAEHGAPAPPDVIVASVWQGTGHEPGSGPLPANLPIADRPLAARRGHRVLGGHDAHVRRRRGRASAVRAQEALVRDGARASAARRCGPAITGRELHAMACDVFEAAGHRTQRTGPGEDPDEGFQFSLGHGVGLEVHEAPGLGDRPRAAGRRRRDRDRARAVGARRSAGCASRTCCWSPRTAARR